MDDDKDRLKDQMGRLSEGIGRSPEEAAAVKAYEDEAFDKDACLPDLGVWLAKNKI